MVLIWIHAKLKMWLYSVLEPYMVVKFGVPTTNMPNLRKLSHDVERMYWLRSRTTFTCRFVMVEVFYVHPGECGVQTVYYTNQDFKCMVRKAGVIQDGTQWNAAFIKGEFSPS